MEDYQGHALSIDISKPAEAVAHSAVDQISRQADELMGTGPVPESRDWLALSGMAATQRELAVQLLQLRIALRVGLDPLGTVIGLRRWGATWEQISLAAGTSRQASYERWGKRVRDILDRYRTGELGGPVAKDEFDLT